MRVTEIPPTACMICHMPIDAATNAYNNRLPKPGDATMCFGCGTFFVFTDEMKLRPPTAIELMQLSNDRQVKQMVQEHAKLRMKRQ